MRRENTMGVKNYSNFFALLLLAGATIAGYMWLIRQPIFEEFIFWAQENFVVYFAALVLVKFLAIVWPPLPGGILTLGSIPVIGWFPAFLADALGGLSGASAAYYLGRKYGRKFLGKVLDEKMIARIERIKVRKNREIETIFFLRMFSGVISEAISYGSGFWGIKYRSFFLATSLAVLTAMPIFYFVNEIFAGRNVMIYAPFVIILAFLFWKMRGRYFE